MCPRGIRTIACLLVLVAAALSAAEPLPAPDGAHGVAGGEAPAFPLWDGEEAIEAYAERAGLPASKTFDLGGGEKLEFVLIPAGRFRMGRPTNAPPVQPAEDEFIGISILAGGAAIAVAFLLFAWIRTRRRKQRFSFSLLRLLFVSVALGVAVYGAVRWRQCAAAWKIYDDEALRYAFRKARNLAASDDAAPAHWVTLTRPFYLSRYELTQPQYDLLLHPGQPVSGPSVAATFSVHPFSPTPTPEDCCFRISTLLRENIWLPTEAQWEFACRAGTDTAYNLGEGPPDLDRAGWFHANTRNIAGSRGPQVIGQKAPNRWGLHDMHGNAAEVCRDAPYRYYASPETDPDHANASADDYLVRGGSVDSTEEECAAYSRKLVWKHGASSKGPPFTFGLRVALYLSQDEAVSETLRATALIKLEKQWENLRAPEGSELEDAVRSFKAWPKEAAWILGDHLEQLNRRTVKGLLMGAGNIRSSGRSRAAQAVFHLDWLVEDQLKDALNDPEYAGHTFGIHEALNTFKTQHPEFGEPVRRARAFALLEAIGTPNARAVLERVREATPSKREAAELGKIIVRMTRAGEK